MFWVGYWPGMALGRFHAQHYGSVLATGKLISRLSVVSLFNKLSWERVAGWCIVCFAYYCP